MRHLYVQVPSEKVAVGSLHLRNQVQSYSSVECQGVPLQVVWPLKSS